MRTNMQTGYDTRYPNAPPVDNYVRNYPSGDAQQCEATMEPITNQISNRLDQALKMIDALINVTRDRADQLIGSEITNTKPSDGNCKTPPSLDRGVMERIVRQTKEVMVTLEYLEMQIRRFHQL